MIDLTYNFKKEETKKNGSFYFKKGMGKREKPIITPYEFGSLLIKKKKHNTIK